MNNLTKLFLLGATTFFCSQVFGFTLECKNENYLRGYKIEQTTKGNFNVYFPKYNETGWSETPQKTDTSKYIDETEFEIKFTFALKLPVPGTTEKTWPVFSENIVLSYKNGTARKKGRLFSPSEHIASQEVDLTCTILKVEANQ